MIINIGFMHEYKQTNESDIAEEELQMSAFMTSWVLNFGDFGQLQLESGTQIVLFFFWSVVLPLLCMNLLIAFLSDTYERVYDHRKKANFIEIIDLAIDLETLMFWNRDKCENMHLVYAELKEEEAKESDITIGIGQKVSTVGNKINAKIDDSMKEMKKEII